MFHNFRGIQTTARELPGILLQNSQERGVFDDVLFWPSSFYSIDASFSYLRRQDAGHGYNHHLLSYQAAEVMVSNCPARPEYLSSVLP